MSDDKMDTPIERWRIHMPAGRGRDAGPRPVAICGTPIWLGFGANDPAKVTCLKCKKKMGK